MLNNNAISIFMWLISGKLNSAFMSVNELLVRNTWKLFSHPNMYFLCHLDLFLSFVCGVSLFYRFLVVPKRIECIILYPHILLLGIWLSHVTSILHIFPCVIWKFYFRFPSMVPFSPKDYFSYLFIDVPLLFWDVKMICELCYSSTTSMSLFLKYLLLLFPSFHTCKGEKTPQ